MSKSRIMGAASSGYNYGANKNSPGNGNGKWQGLWPSVGHARNARYINTRAGGDNRNVVFCMNQLGGVGRISNMFATTADGVKQPCPGSESFFGAAALTAVQILQEYLKAKYGDSGSLILVGRHETLKSDGVICNYCDKIQHYDPTHQEYYTLPPRVRAAADVLNALQIRLPLKPGGEPVLHIAGYESFVGQRKLIENGYGKPLQFGPGVFIMTYGFTPYTTACTITRALNTGENGCGTINASDPFGIWCCLLHRCNERRPLECAGYDYSVGIF